MEVIGYCYKHLRFVENNGACKLKSLAIIIRTPWLNEDNEFYIRRKHWRTPWLNEDNEFYTRRKHWKKPMS